MRLRSSDLSLGSTAPTSRSTDLILRSTDPIPQSTDLRRGSSDLSHGSTDLSLGSLDPRVQSDVAGLEWSKGTSPRPSPNEVSSKMSCHSEG